MPHDRVCKLDLPTRKVPSSYQDGSVTAHQLAFDVLGKSASVTPLGFVRNVVLDPAGDYEWPVTLRTSHCGLPIVSLSLPELGLMQATLRQRSQNVTGFRSSGHVAEQTPPKVDPLSGR